MADALLEVAALTLSQGGCTLVRELSFEVHAGDMCCLLGPNGAGKTTLLHALAGLHAPHSGHVRLGGRPLSDWSGLEAARLRAFLPQTWHDAFSSGVLDIVMLGRHPYLAGGAWEGDAERGMARAVLDAMELTGFEERDVMTLSGGERQRVALATVLVQDAPLLLLDEPLSHLDLHHAVLVLKHLRGLASSCGKGVLFTVHDLNLAARFASHALILSGRESIRYGPAEQVMRERELTEAFGHRVARLETAERTLFVAE